VRRLAVAGAAVITLVSLVPLTPAQAETVRDAQWWIGPLQLDQAHKEATGAGVTVGVVDSPIDANHPDLSGRILPGGALEAGGPKDGWGDGPSATHGTSMAGIIVGKGTGSAGYLGIAPDSKVLPFASRSGEFRHAAAGIRWLTDRGAKVINVSIGSPAAATAEEVSAVKYALEHDVVVVAATGNRQSVVSSPANIPGVVAVSGVDMQGNAWSGATTGPEVVLTAPAVEIIYPAPKGTAESGYRIADGTSQATAIVAGVAALIRSKYPDLNAASVIERLIKTARDNGEPGRDPKFGFGTIRPLEALTANVAAVAKNPLVEPTSGTPGSRVPSPPPDTSTGDKDSADSLLVPVLLAIVGGVAFVIVLIVIVMLSRRKREGPGYGVARPQQGYPPPGDAPQDHFPPSAPSQVPHQATRHHPPH
jgi:type VII secretion-associated serine protease mycosin